MSRLSESLRTFTPHIRGVTLFVGNSLTIGPGGNSSPVFSYPAKVMARLNNDDTWQNLGIQSLSTPQMAVRGPTDVDSQYLVNRPCRVLVWEGTNDIFATRSPGAQAAANLRAYCENRRAAGFHVIILTILNLISGAMPTFDTERTAANAIIRNTWPQWADGIADVAARAELSDPSNMTYFAADNTHLTALGCDVVAEVAYNALSMVP